MIFSPAGGKPFSSAAENQRGKNNNAPRNGTDQSDQPNTQPPSTSSDIVRFRIKINERGKKAGSIEICCGYAGLTAALADAGLEAIGIDWKGNRHQPQVPILKADLTTEQGRGFVRNLVRQDHVLYVHLAPPCGTYTRAREIPTPQWKPDKYPNMPNPKPLRTD